MKNAMIAATFSAIYCYLIALMRLFVNHEPVT